MQNFRLSKCNGERRLNRTGHQQSSGACEDFPFFVEQKFRERVGVGIQLVQDPLQLAEEDVGPCTAVFFYALAVTLAFEPIEVMSLFGWQWISKPTKTVVKVPTAVYSALFAAEVSYAFA